jgi:hypothetical protein
MRRRGRRPTSTRMNMRLIRRMRVTHALKDIYSVPFLAQESSLLLLTRYIAGNGSKNLAASCRFGHAATDNNHWLLCVGPGLSEFTYTAIVKP